VGDDSALRDAIFRQTDLGDRLEVLPPSARVRGLYFRSIETALAPAGQLDRYRALFPERYSMVPWYPTREFLVRVNTAAALLAGVSEINHGLHEIGRLNAVAFAESLVGKTLLRLLSPDPKRLLHQAVAGARQSREPGRWTLTISEDQSAVISMTEEYLYIESYLLGAARGTFEAAGIPLRAEAVLRDRFSGDHILKW
jgi:uncharacterized protein (TIGR02265 family)